MNASTSVHKDLNNGTANTTALADLVDKACWACHGNGSQPPPGQHPADYRTPRLCPDCHTNSTGGYNASTGKGNYSAPFIFEHNPYSTGDVTTTAQCWDCHNNSVAANNDAENGTTINNSKKSNISHYGIIANLVNTTNCTDCHKIPANAAKWGDAVQVSAGMGTTNADCYLCHMDTVNAAPETFIGFHEGNVTEWNWNSCDTCHYTGGRRS
jgi:cytochrome c5